MRAGSGIRQVLPLLLLVVSGIVLLVAAGSLGSLLLGLAVLPAAAALLLYAFDADVLDTAARPRLARAGILIAVTSMAVNAIITITGGRTSTVVLGFTMAGFGVTIWGLGRPFLRPPPATPHATQDHSAS